MNMKYGNPQIEFSADELREMQDALHWEIKRLCEVGQSAQEQQYRSLAHAWSARKKVIDYLLPTPLPDWVAQAEQQVLQALAQPVLLPEPDGS